MRGFIGYEGLNEVVNDKSMPYHFFENLSVKDISSTIDVSRQVIKNSAHTGCKFHMQHYGSNKR